MKKMHVREPASRDPEVASQGAQGTQEEPEVEPELPIANNFPENLDDDDFPDDATDDAGEEPENLTVDVVDLPDTVYPTLD